MITFLLGLPGSGKSYEGVNKIYHNFSNDEEAKKDRKATFKNCYTNINEFKFDKVENVHELVKDDIIEIITYAHGMFKKKSTDEEILKYLDEHNLKDTLFVIDEAHNWFDVPNTVLIWWLSYHRHLYHEIVLITQNLSLVNSKYKAFSEFFYVARPQSLTLDKRFFYYTIYCSSRLTKNSKSGVKKVRRNKKVFELYKSGDSIEAQNVVLKFLMFVLILSFILGFGFYYYFVIRISSIKKDPISDKEKITQVEQKKSKISSKSITDKVINSQELEQYQDDKDYSNIKFFNLTCTSSICSNNFISLHPQLLRKFIQDKQINVLHSYRSETYLYEYYLDSSKDFYTYLTSKGENDESDTIMFDSPRSALGVQ